MLGAELQDTVTLFVSLLMFGTMLAVFIIMARGAQDDLHDVRAVCPGYLGMAGTGVRAANSALGVITASGLGAGSAGRTNS